MSTLLTEEMKELIKEHRCLEKEMRSDKTGKG